MSTHAVVPLLTPLDVEQIPIISLPVLVHKHIVRFFGGGGEDVPETYGASLVVLGGVMPYYEETVQRGLVQNLLLFVPIIFFSYFSVFGLVEAGMGEYC